MTVVCWCDCGDCCGYIRGYMGSLINNLLLGMRIPTTSEAMSILALSPTGTIRTSFTEDAAVATLNKSGSSDVEYGGESEVDGEVERKGDVGDEVMLRSEDVPAPVTPSRNSVGVTDGDAVPGDGTVSQHCHVWGVVVLCEVVCECWRVCCAGGSHGPEHNVTVEHIPLFWKTFVKWFDVA